MVSLDVYGEIKTLNHRKITRKTNKNSNLLKTDSHSRNPEFPWNPGWKTMFCNLHY